MPTYKYLGIQVIRGADQRIRCGTREMLFARPGILERNTYRGRVLPPVKLAETTIGLFQCRLQSRALESHRGNSQAQESPKELPRRQW